MLMIFASLTLCYLVVSGLGLLVSPTAGRLDVLGPVLRGMLVAAGVASFVNFAFPIDGMVTAPFLLVGLFGRFRCNGWQGLREHIPLFCAFALLAVLLTAAPENFDTGLYHLPQLEWLRQTPTPIGVANLHARLAFASIWFPLAAILRFPFLNLSAAFCVNALLYSVCLYQLWLWSRGQRLIVLVMLATALVVPQLFSLYRLSSPSTDVPATLLIMLGLVNALLKDTHKQDDTFVYFLSAALIKPIALPLVVAQLILQRPSVRALALPLSLLVFTAVRSTLLSGCLAYPVGTTCLALPWTPPAEKVAADAAFVAQRALKPLPDATGTVLGHGLQAWQEFLLSPSAIAVLALVFLLASITLATPREKRGRWSKAELAWFVALSVGAVSWYAQTPYIRMGLVYIVCLPLFPFFVWLKDREISKNQALGGIATAACLGLAQLNATELRPFAPWPRIPQQALETNRNEQGRPVYRPMKGIKCWDLPIPCTTHFDPSLAYTIDTERFIFWPKGSAVR